MKEREEIELLAEIEGHDLGLLVIDFHFILLSECQKVSKLVLQS